MKVRAVICDLYHTLLEVGPPPADAHQRWNKLGHATLAGLAPPSLEEFASRCDKIIAREHAAADAAGAEYPEVYWPAVAREAMPELACLSDQSCDEFLYQHAQLQRTIRLMAGAAKELRELRQARMQLGLASNAQPYSVRELEAALQSADLPSSLFRPELCFLSFQHGFGKPASRVFRLLTARLRALGIAPGETLMLGDREDNDVAPALAHGWQAWKLTPSPAQPGQRAGDWASLGAWLRSNGVTVAMAVRRKEN